MTMHGLQEWLTFIDTLGDVGNSARELMVRTAHEMDALQLKRTDKAGSTETRPIAAGSAKVTAILPEPKIDVSRLPPKTLAERIAEEAAICEGCDGTDCPKTHDRWRFPKLEVEWWGETAQYYICDYGERFKRQRNLQSKIRSSRIPARYVGKTFDDYTVDKFNRDAVQFAKNIDKYKFGAYLYGECGTGKTFLASLIAQDFLSRNKSVVFVKVPSLLDDIKSTFNGGKDANELDILDALRNSDLVVMDDFGMEKSTQWAGSTLCKVLDMRYDNPRGKTIVTSNLSVDELTYHLNNASDGVNLNGSRIADRLREICKPILLRGVTRRG